MTTLPRSSYLVPVVLASPSPALLYPIPTTFPSKSHPPILPQCISYNLHLTKIIFTCRSCLLHRFLKNEWRILSSQTIGVEFASKIIKVGTGARRKRIKLQLWDTAGTERFRSVSRSYYRGAAGAILIYDVASSASFEALPTFLMDARALASPNLTILLAGNKQDLATGMPIRPNSQSSHDEAAARQAETPSSISSRQSYSSFPLEAGGGSAGSIGGLGSLRTPTTSTPVGTKQTATTSPDGREVSTETASRWASRSLIPVAVEVSALSGDNVEELFSRLARMILTKIELGDIDPDDPQSGIQYGDVGMWGTGDMGSIKSGEEDSILMRRRGNGKSGRKRSGTGLDGWMGGMREWEDVFRISGTSSRRRGVVAN